MFCHVSIQDADFKQSETQHRIYFAASSQILIIDPDRSVQIITVLSQRQKPFYLDDNSKTCPSLAWLVGGASQEAIGIQRALHACLSRRTFQT